PRADGSFANPNLLATHVLLLAPLAIAFALTAVAREVKVTLFALAALAYLGLILTFSRAALGAALLAGLVVAWSTRPAWRPRLRIAVGAAVVLLLLGIVATGGDLVGGFGRPEAWKLAVKVWSHNVLTGVGLGRAGDALNAAGGAAITYRHAHNLWLTWLVEAGPLAFAAWIWMTGWLLWRGWRAALRTRVLAAASLAAAVGFFAFSLLDHPSNTERIATAFWFVAALIAAGVRPPEGVWLLDRLGGRRRAGPAVAALGAIAVLALAGCGGDKEKSSTSASAPAPPPATPAGTNDTTATTAPDTSTATTDTTAPPATTGAAPTTGATPPESQPGGAGDEAPIGVPADFVGKGGRLTPRKVRVPPFIAVTVTLRSGDGGSYALTINGHTLIASGGKRVTLKLAGLHQGQSIQGTYRGGKVSIEASAEPGP
ncbi:MAG: hypothetical protein QOJ07_1990, partial [Thermoleophilaceae bacterium]|nr:hypothetical protein [Thermoleophilaceae bacterium]